MKEKKNIDRIFQEKFKDFEEDPREKIWKNISKELDNKGKKRGVLIPLWLQLGGVAAIVAILLAGILLQDNSNLFNEEPEVVNEDSEYLDDSEESFSTEEGITESSDNNPKNENSSKINQKSEQPVNTPKEAEIQSQEKPSNFNSQALKKRQNKNIVFAIGSKENSERFNEKEKEAAIPEDIKSQSSGVLAIAKAIGKDSLENHFIKENEFNALAEEEKKIKEAKSEAIAETNSKNIRLSTFAAPVFYKNIGSGNEISSQFDNNNSSSEVTISYGFKVAYQLSEKIKIRTGISKINMSYNIEDISYSPAAMGVSIENINPASGNLSIRSDAGNPENRGNSFAETAISSFIFTPGEINQKFGFLEVPLEIEYAIIDKRFGLNIIGGGSSLFLDNNSVSLVAGEDSTNLGTARNINSTSFSTNIGLGLDYQINDRFSLNFEPIFKYQINTFSNVNNVQPVNFGIYSGLSFRF